MTRGRNKELIARRDEMLCRRYHYWTEIERLRFDDALTQLSQEEFFLSEERILTILRHNSHRLAAIAADGNSRRTACILRTPLFRTAARPTRPRTPGGSR